MKRITSPADIEARYANFLGDESKMRAARVHDICLPTSTAELSEALAENFAAKRPTRVSGGRTGITGASVAEPDESIVSVDAMKQIGPVELDAEAKRHFIRVQAGVTLHQLNEHLAEIPEKVFYPVDPTETWAAFGGMASTNASGARSYRYGATRGWIRSARVVLADGSVLDLKRGRDKLSGVTLRILFGEKERAVTLEPVPKPATKNTIGYTIAPDMDILDLFIGAEGTLGVFADLDLWLEPATGPRLTYMQLFSSTEKALVFVEVLRELKQHEILAIEFLDKNALGYGVKNPNGAKSAPARLVDAETAAAVYIEAVYRDDAEMEAILAALESALAEIGESTERSFAGAEERDLRELKTFRHAVPEQINATIAQRKKDIPGLHKISTDMAVPASALGEILRIYETTLAREGLEHAIFGHAGSSHLHVNILPRSSAELEKAMKVYKEFAVEVVRLKGAVAAEHGIGRIKRDFLNLQYTSDEIARMLAVKNFFDEYHLLNRGVLFPDAA